MSSSRLRLVADENMPGVEACCAHLGCDIEVVRRPGRGMTAADVAGADILLVRSITQVDAALLAGSPVRFVGTATIGTDHLDIPWLEEQDIAWASAPGCNARAVGEWVLDVLVQLAAEQGVVLAGRTLGIIGLGHVGRQVAQLVRHLGIRVVACDPFLTAADLPPALADVPLLALNELLAVVDMVTVHTPLTRSGPHPTHHLLDADQLARLRPGAWLINAARGPVVANAALSAALTRGGLTAVLDVWEGEPNLDAGLLAQVRQGSPHIAGHSLEGKWRGTWQIIDAAARHLGLSFPVSLPELLPNEGARDLHLAPPGTASTAARLAALLNDVIDLAGDDARLRAARQEPQPAAAFDRLRKTYPIRREFPAHRVLIDPATTDDPLPPVLKALGFNCQ